MHVAPAVVDEESELGARYIAAMELAGRYAYGGREWVVERVRQIVGGSVTDGVHNHHNYAWRERHDGRDLWVVRKGAVPSPGQPSDDDPLFYMGEQDPTKVSLWIGSVGPTGF